MKDLLLVSAGFDGFVGDEVVRTPDTPLTFAGSLDPTERPSNEVNVPKLVA